MADRYQLNPKALREYLVANMFDGSDDGQMTMRTADLMDEIVELVADFINPDTGVKFDMDEQEPEWQNVPEWVDSEMPHRGPCGICGGPDARHRILDAMAERMAAGESAADISNEYGFTIPFIALVRREWVI